MAIPRFFHPLVKALEESRLRGLLKPLRSWVGLRIPTGTYAEAKVSSFKQYTTAAEKAGLVELGGQQAKAWIALRPEWHGKIHISCEVAPPTASLPIEVSRHLAGRVPRCAISLCHQGAAARYDPWNRRPVNDIFLAARV